MLLFYPPFGKYGKEILPAHPSMLAFVAVFINTRIPHIETMSNLLTDIESDIHTTKQLIHAEAEMVTKCRDAHRLQQLRRPIEELEKLSTAVSINLDKPDLMQKQKILRLIQEGNWIPTILSQLEKVKTEFDQLHKSEIQATKTPPIKYTTHPFSNHTKTQIITNELKNHMDTLFPTLFKLLESTDKLKTENTATLAYNATQLNEILHRVHTLYKTLKPIIQHNLQRVKDHIAQTPPN